MFAKPQVVSYHYVPSSNEFALVVKADDLDSTTVLQSQIMDSKSISIDFVSKWIRTNYGFVTDPLVQFKTLSMEQYEYGVVYNEIPLVQAQWAMWQKNFNYFVVNPESIKSSLDVNQFCGEFRETLNSDILCKMIQGVLNGDLATINIPSGTPWKFIDAAGVILEALGASKAVWSMDSVHCDFCARLQGLGDLPAVQALHQDTKSIVLKGALDAMQRKMEHSINDLVTNMVINNPFIAPSEKELIQTIREIWSKLQFAGNDMVLDIPFDQAEKICQAVIQLPKNVATACRLLEVLNEGTVVQDMIQLAVEGTHDIGTQWRDVFDSVWGNFYRWIKFDLSIEWNPLEFVLVGWYLSLPDTLPMLIQFVQQVSSDEDWKSKQRILFLVLSRDTVQKQQRKMQMENKDAKNDEDDEDDEDDDDDDESFENYIIERFKRIDQEDEMFKLRRQLVVSVIEKISINVIASEDWKEITHKLMKWLNLCVTNNESMAQMVHFVCDVVLPKINGCQNTFRFVLGIRNYYFFTRGISMPETFIPMFDRELGEVNAWQYTNIQKVTDLSEYVELW